MISIRSLFGGFQNRVEDAGDPAEYRIQGVEETTLLFKIQDIKIQKTTKIIVQNSWSPQPFLPIGYNLLPGHSEVDHLNLLLLNHLSLKLLFSFFFHGHSLFSFVCESIVSCVPFIESMAAMMNYTTLHNTLLHNTTLHQ